MRRPAIARDLVPVNEFRANLASWLRRASESGRPVVITQHGKAAAVLVDPAALDELDEAREVVRHLVRGLEDVQQDRLHEDDDVWAEVDALIEAADRARPVE